MRSRLMTRLKRLEALTPPVPTLVQVGWVTRLPSDYTGERHTVITKREPTGSGNIEWCQFEECPGPAPDSLADPEFQVHLTR
jgi:hypothetical protein